MADSAGGEPLVGVLLAAGRGSRMGVLTAKTPKPLLPVLEKPALHRVLDGLIAAGIRRFIVVTGYMSDLVRTATEGYGGDAVEIHFVHQDEQHGTGHAVQLTREAVNGAPVFLAFTDIMTSAGNYTAMVRKYRECNCDIVAAVRDAGDPWRAAAVYVNSAGAIERIIEKPQKGSSTTPWSHAGMYCFSNSIFDYIEQLQPSARGEYEITDAVQMMVADGRKSRAVELHGYWKDLASPQDIIAAEELMTAEAAESHVL